MIDDRNPSHDAGEDPEVDALFASAGRFPTQLDFEDRVLRVVALPLPDWALRIRNLSTTLFRSLTGRVMLVGLGLGVVTSITFIARWVRINGHQAGQWIGGWVGEPSLPSVRSVMASLTDAATAFVPAGLVSRSTAMIAAAVVGVSAVGLYITAGPPALRSRHAR